MEHLDIHNKIKLLNSAKLVVTPAGGGLANLLVANPPTKIISINSPLFWKVNQRLRFAFDHLEVIDFDDTNFTNYKEPLSDGTQRISAEGGLNSPWSCNLNGLLNIIKANL